MPDRPPMTYVVAATQRRFRAWCQDNERSPRDPTVRGIDRLEQVRGLLLRRGVDKVVDLGGDYRLLLELNGRYRA